MSVPDYKRPFGQEDFRGYIRWTKKLSKKLDGACVYHACHEKELKKYIECGHMTLRSEWSLIHPTVGKWTSPGVWCGLNFFHSGNNYGPILLKYPITVLEGSQFMVFRRLKGRKRYFFVNYETRIPVFTFKGETWRKPNPSAYFDECNEGLNLKSGAIYDIVLTVPLSLEKATIKGVSHPKCIPAKCKGNLHVGKSREIVQKHASNIFKEKILRSSEYERFITQFPDMIGEEIKLPVYD